MKNINQCHSCLNNMVEAYDQEEQPASCILDYINTRSTGNIKVLNDAAMKACIVHQWGECPKYEERRY